MSHKETAQNQDKENPHRAQLMHDWPSAIAIFTVVAASVGAGASILSLFSTISPYPMSQPQFWILAIPVIIWVSYLQKYKPIAVIIFRAMMILVIPITLAITLISYKLDPGSIHFYIGTTVFSSVLIAISAWFYRKSVLRKEGPLR